MQLQILSRASLSTRSVRLVHVRQALGFTITQNFVQQTERVVLNQLVGAHPAEPLSQVRHVIILGATENDSNSEVNDLLDAIQITSGAVAVHRNAVSNLRQDQRRHQHLDDMGRNMVPQVSQTCECAEAATRQLCNVTVPAETPVKDDAEVFHLRTRHQRHAAEIHGDWWEASDVLVTAEDDDLGFASIYFQAVGTEPLV